MIEQTDWGQFKVSSTGDKRAVGVTLESALTKFLAGQNVPQALVYNAAEVIETALGEDVRGGGQIHEGVVSA